MFLKLIFCLFQIQTVFGNSRKFNNAINQQNMQTILYSIEERLRNLDTIYNAQYSPSIEGKLEQYLRRLEALDVKINRFESSIRSDIEKLSDDGFKNSLAQEHHVARLVHNLRNIETIIEVKLNDKIDALIKRFDKMEDTLITRQSDMEVEIADVLSVADEIKLTCGSVDQANLTKTFELSVTNSEENIIENVIRGFNKLGNGGDKFQESLDGYGVKLSENVEAVEARMETIGAVLNETRVEQQSGLRSLTVEVGRLVGKNFVYIKTKEEEDETNGTLKALADKMNSNFDQVISLQQGFWDSCHRIQMDEAQLESKIGEVLEKLVETYEERSAKQIRDIHELKQTVMTFNGNLRNFVYSSFQNVIHKCTDEKNALNSIRTQLLWLTNEIEYISRFLKEANVNSTEMGQMIQSHLTQVSQQTSQNNLDIQTGLDISKTFQTEIISTLTNLQDMIHSYEGLLLNNTSDEDFNLNKTIIDIFGTNPSVTTEETLVFERNETTNCLGLDVRAGSENNCTININEDDSDQMVFTDSDVNVNIAIDIDPRLENEEN